MCLHIDMKGHRSHLCPPPPSYSPLSENDSQGSPPIWLALRNVGMSSDQHLPVLPLHPDCRLLLLHELQVGLPTGRTSHTTYIPWFWSITTELEIGDPEAQAGTTQFTRGLEAEYRPRTPHLPSTVTYSDPSPIWSCPTVLTLEQTSEN